MKTKSCMFFLITVMFMSINLFGQGGAYSSFLNSGVEKFKAGDYAGSISQFDMAIYYKEPSGTAYYLRGCAHKILKKYDEAIFDFSKSIQLGPNFAAESYLGRGMAKIEMGNARGAISDYDNAILLKPDLGNVYFHRCLAKRYLNDDKGACNDYKKSIQLGFKSPNGYGDLPELCK